MVDGGVLLGIGGELFGDGAGFGIDGAPIGGGAFGGMFSGTGACAGSVMGGDSRGDGLLPGGVVPGGGCAGVDCSGTVGGADGVTLLTATRTFSMPESTSSMEKLGRPRGSLTSTLLFSPSSTL